MDAGHINHSLFWKNLAGAASENKGVGGALKDGPLKSTIERDFGSLDNLKKAFNASTAGIQGSGWGWLVCRPFGCPLFCIIADPGSQGFNTVTQKLEVTTTPNQDPLLAPYVPIIGVDIWEHAFYLQYLNVKVDVSLLSTPSFCPMSHVDFPVSECHLVGHQL